jgi:hypothetical protein
MLRKVDETSPYAYSECLKPESAHVAQHDLFLYETSVGIIESMSLNELKTWVTQMSLEEALFGLKGFGTSAAINTRTQTTSTQN